MKSIALDIQQRLEAEQALLARELAPFDHLADEAARIEHRRRNTHGRMREGTLHHAAGRLDQDGGKGTDDDDHHRRG